MRSGKSWLEGIGRGEVRAIARAATLIENRAPEALPLLRELYARSGRARTLGITGPPGAGKSTLTSSLAARFRQLGHRVAVVAVDPTSPFSGGAILGDRIRMQRHHGDAGVFIRSMATRGAMGGLAPAAFELCLLLDAAGFDLVLVETVGVGQDEVDVARIADCTAVVLAPGMGDDVQAIKAGLLEIADVYVLNKADLAGADRLESEIRGMLELSGRGTPVLRAIAIEDQGAAELAPALLAMPVQPERRARKWAWRLTEMYRERVLRSLDAAELDEAAARVAAGRLDPYTVIEEWLARPPQTQKEKWT